MGAGRVAGASGLETQGFHVNDLRIVVGVGGFRESVAARFPPPAYRTCPRLREPRPASRELALQAVRNYPTASTYTL